VSLNDLVCQVLEEMGPDEGEDGNSYYRRREFHKFVDKLKKALANRGDNRRELY